jgi:hypothetical protein
MQGAQYLNNLCFFAPCTDIDVSDIEELRSRKIELETRIVNWEDGLKSLQKELMQSEDELAKIHKKRVSSFFEFTCLGHRS